MTKGIVVGFDESPSAAQALRWGRAFGAARGLPVRVLMAWDYLSQHQVDPEAPFDPTYDEQSAAGVLDELVVRVLGSSDGVECVAVLDRAGEALVQASQDAELLVVGARGLGGFRGLLLGSVSRQVLHHAMCPVAVVRGEFRESAGPIVVGVDGSETSIRALEWAASCAAATGRTLVAVRAWHQIFVAGPVYVLPDARSLASSAGDELQRTLEQADVSGVPVETQVVEGRAAAELLAIAATQQASMLVVGARGSTHVGGPVLGSVSDQVVHHADLPVVVVP